MPFGLKEKCGVFGIWGHAEAANLTYLGLYALQHRGQEGAGIVSSDGRKFHLHRGMGLVADVFGEAELRHTLPGHIALGHVRYSTTGESSDANLQPLLADYRGKISVALGHNGNLVNTDILKRELVEKGVVFYTTLDTEIIMNLLTISLEPNFPDALAEALLKVRGAYTLLILAEHKLIGVRDPYGFRPLCLGMKDGAYVLSSESCALDLIEADFVRDIEPGEMVVIDEHGVSSYKPFPKKHKALCIFEYIYFARPDSCIDGYSVMLARKALGRRLAGEHPVEADIVVPVPDSGKCAALGYAEEANIPFEEGLIRNHYIGRTFIEPRQSIRNFGVKIKLNAVRQIIAGKRVIVVDDSIVRGTTSRKIVGMIRRAGAKEVHMRVSSPPSKYPCFYGIDTPVRWELIAAKHSVKQISRFLGADSVGYLTLKGAKDAVSGKKDGFCAACFSGRYPVGTPTVERYQLELFHG